jgi:hypothetical protein
MIEMGLRAVGVLLLVVAGMLFRNKSKLSLQANAGAALTGAIGLLSLNLINPWLSYILVAAAIGYALRSAMRHTSSRSTAA